MRRYWKSFKVFVYFLMLPSTDRKEKIILIYGCVIIKGKKVLFKKKILKTSRCDQLLVSNILNIYSFLNKSVKISKNTIWKAFKH